MGWMRNVLVAAAVVALTTVVPTGSVSAVASMSLEVTATSTPTYWLEDRTYELLVTNTGDEAIVDVAAEGNTPELTLLGVVPAGAPTPVVGNADDVFEPGEQWRFDIVVPTISQWGFLVEGSTAGGDPVSVFERSERHSFSSAFTIPASIEIDDPSGRFPAGTELTFTVTAANEVDIPLTLVCEHAIDDALLTKDLEPIGAPDANGNGDDILDPGEQWAWSVTHTLEASGQMLHVFCDLDRSDEPTGGLRLREGGRLIALTLPPATLMLEVTPGSSPTFWLEDRTYEFVVTNTGEVPLDFLEIYARSTDLPPGDGEPPPAGQRGMSVAFTDDEFGPGEQVELAGDVPTIASWTFTAVAQTPGGIDVIDQASGERDVPDDAYVDPVAVDLGFDDLDFVVVGEDTTVELANIADFDVVVTVDDPWSPPNVVDGVLLQPGETLSWSLPTPFGQFSFAYERPDVGLALSRSIDPVFVIVDTFPPTTTLPTTTTVVASRATLPDTGGGATLVPIALAVTLVGAGLILLARRRPDHADT